MNIAAKEHVSILKGRAAFKLAAGTNKFDAEMVQPGSLARVQHEYNDHVLHIP